MSWFLAGSGLMERLSIMGSVGGEASGRAEIELGLPAGCIWRGALFGIATAFEAYSGLALPGAWPGSSGSGFGFASSFEILLRAKAYDGMPPPSNYFIFSSNFLLDLLFRLICLYCFCINCFI